jgi:hypothetical protein
MIRAPLKSSSTSASATCFARLAGNVERRRARQLSRAPSFLSEGRLRRTHRLRAIKGAIDDVEMGNLTSLLARIKPAITETTFAGDKSSKNAAYVDAVARTNVELGLKHIRRRSPILADLEQKHTILLVGAMYDLATGAVEFLA